MTQTYIYDGVEVKLTGRKAIRNLPQPAKPSRIQQSSSDLLFEVEPSDPEALSFKKWVKMDQLYVIVENENDTK